MTKPKSCRPSRSWTRRRTRLSTWPGRRFGLTFCFHAAVEGYFWNATPAVNKGFTVIISNIETLQVNKMMLELLLAPRVSL